MRTQKEALIEPKPNGPGKNPLATCQSLGRLKTGGVVVGIDLKRYDKDAEVEDMQFNFTHFWVQVHGILICFRNKQVAEGLCELVGKVAPQTTAHTMDGGGFMRVRVNVDISLPLCHGRVIALDDDKVQWVSFKYERLPNLCYWCGCLTHNDRDCDLWIDSEGTLIEADKQYGPWIKASPFTGYHKAIVTVPGYYAKTQPRKTSNVSPEPSRKPPTTTTSTQTQTTTTHPKKVTVETVNCSFSNFNDPFLNENTITDTLHLNRNLSHMTRMTNFKNT
ncbi:hypothetical protein SO802_010696 [Lithocarpus litseifolius]|uniref:Zinc knuckle CX2CX4HX4C domain-containing protein n=1 Tax=Lithocarpus litseifolius TaxID=425828 RepID=A0AAW2DG53_9ROSI